MLIHDDGAFGSIAAYQVRNHGRAYATDLHNPDLVAFVRSFGIPAERVDDIADLPAAMGRATAGSGPVGGDPRRAARPALELSRGRLACAGQAMISSPPWMSTFAPVM